jgi:hypothetical protein
MSHTASASSRCAMSLPPLLEFRFGQKLVYPRDGLFLYGPIDGGRPEINCGVIGTPVGIARLERWTQSIAGFIAPPPRRRGAKPVEPQHVPFPGFAAAYNSGWPIKPRTAVATIDGAALSKALHIDNRNEAIKAAVDLYVTPLIAAAARVEDPPTFWFVVIPEEVYELGRPLSKVPVPERIRGSVRITKDQALRLEDEHTLFGIDEAEAEVYKYATHFRRQLKARLLNDKIVTQIVRIGSSSERWLQSPPPTRDPFSLSSRRLEHVSRDQQDSSGRPAKLLHIRGQSGKKWACCAQAVSPPVKMQVGNVGDRKLVVHDDVLPT